MSVAAITVFHPVSDQLGFRSWAQRLLVSAHHSAGNTAGQLSMHFDPKLDAAVLVRFATEDALHDWLDSEDRAQVLRDGAAHGYWRMTSDLVVPDDGLPPPGMAVFGHQVDAAKTSEFEAGQIRLADEARKFRGFEGTVVFGADPTGSWNTAIRFRTAEQLARWWHSAERAAALPALRTSLSEDFTAVAHTTAFGSTLRTENGRTRITPKWKTAMLLLLVLYPVVMLLSRFVGPHLAAAGAKPWLVMWLSQICSVGLLSFVFMPRASALFRRWLDPVDGGGLRRSLIGAVVIVALYAATMLLFASVHWLQFWDYDN